MKLFHLVYESKEVTKFSAEDLEKLAYFSSKNNALSDITGLLIRNKNVFTQYLEGAKTEVTMLYESILRDKRHDCIVLLQKGFIDQRKFGQWNMLVKDLSHNDIENIENNKKLMVNTHHRTSNSPVSNFDLLEQILKNHQISDN